MNEKKKPEENAAQAAEHFRIVSAESRNRAAEEYHKRRYGEQRESR